MDPIKARLFGPGLAPTGEDASLRIVGSYLEVRSARGAQTVSLSSLRFKEVVSAHSGIALSWDDSRGTSVVQVHEPAAMQRLRSDPVLRTLPQMDALRAGQRRGRIGRTVALSLITLFLVMPLLLLLVLFWQADRIAGAIAGRIPVEKEQQFGRRIFEGMRGTLKLKDSGPDYEQVRNIGARLTQGSRFQYEFHVADDPAINAFAMPGGVVVVHTGLIKAVKRPEELAGVLAHEMQHVELRHSLKGLIKEMGLRGLWAASTGDLAGTVAGQAAVKLTSLRFSRDAEREADKHGFATLVSRNIDPQGMVDFFGTMKREAGVTPPAWLSTHPDSQARQESLRGMRTALGDRQFPPLPSTSPVP
jgi:Zn-dependent protease with chaperone function